MKKFLTHSFIAAWLLFFCAAASPAVGQDLLTSIKVSPATFSPDGDGALDVCRVVWELGVDSVLVSVLVFENDSTTVVDTLKTSMVQMVDTCYWDGEYYTDAPAPEGLYILQFHAQKDARDTTVVYPVWIDLTAPRLVFWQSVPAVYVPEVLTQPQTVQVLFEVLDSRAPGSTPAGDLLAVSVKNPSGTPRPQTDSLRVSPAFVGDGVYTVEWIYSAFSQMKEGFYSIEIGVSDNAGHSPLLPVAIDVDVTKPEVKVTNPEAGKVFSVVPDNALGWIYDRHGIDPNSLTVRYSSAGPKMPFQPAYVSNDTAYFAVVLADSIVEEREYTLFFEAKDLVGRTATTFTFKLTLDLTAPAAPTLDPFTGVVHGPVFDLSGEWQGTPDWIRIYRNSALIDSFFTLVQKTLDYRVPVEPGKNTFRVTAVDAAGNASAFSNAVTVTYDPAAGLYIPAPFRPGDEFSINLARQADQVTLRLYGLGGELVIVLEKLSPQQNFLVAWNGRNGSGIDVKKGPLVAVAEVLFGDGSKSVFREIFLFDPDG